MIVRNGNKFDMPYFIKIVRHAHENDLFSDYGIHELNNDYLNSLYQTLLLGTGVVLVLESDTTIGICVGIIAPNTWNPEVKFLHQMLLYVEPEYRKTKGAYKLIKEFDKIAHELRDNNKIDRFVINVSEPLFDIDFSKLGYKVIEKTWLGA